MIEKNIKTYLDSESKLICTDTGIVSNNSDQTAHKDDGICTQTNNKLKNQNISVLVNQKQDSKNVVQEINHQLLLSDKKTDAVEQDILNRLLSDFLNELEYNRKTISEFSGKQLLPLETSIWEANQQLVHNMIPNLKRNFSRLYDDIIQINNLVWLSTEFNHISPNMCAQYTRLSELITVNLDKMIQRIKYLKQVERALSLISVL